MRATNKLLVIVTNVGEYEKVGYRTGLWLSELTHFLDVVEQAGYQTDIASPSGGYVPIDPDSLMLQEAGHVLLSVLTRPYRSNSPVGSSNSASRQIRIALHCGSGLCDACFPSFVDSGMAEL